MWILLISFNSLPFLIMTHHDTLPDDTERPDFASLDLPLPDATNQAAWLAFSTAFDPEKKLGTAQMFLIEAHRALRRGNIDQAFLLLMSAERVLPPDPDPGFQDALNNLITQLCLTQQELQLNPDATITEGELAVRVMDEINTDSPSEDFAFDEIRDILGRKTGFVSYEERIAAIVAVKRRLQRLRRGKIVDIAAALDGKVIGKADDGEDGPFKVGRLAQWVQRRTDTPFHFDESLEANHVFTLLFDRDIYAQLTVLANEASSAERKVTPEQEGFQFFQGSSTFPEALKQYFHSQE